MRLRLDHLHRRAPSPWELYSLLILGGAAVYIPLRYLLPGIPAIHSPFRYLGFACPLCGGTRAVTALCLGDLELALRYNPLALVLFALLTWGVISFLVLVIPWRRRVVLESGSTERRVFWSVALAVFLANWAYVLWSGMYEKPLPGLGS